MTSQVKSMEDLMLNITQEIHVKASLEKTFESLLDQLGPYNETPEGKSLQMKLEPWPGGRWYRDLGDQNGHFWGNVQAIKRPTLLEISGPLFMSYAVISNVQYRLSKVEGGTMITFHHYAFGVIPDEVRKNINTGWKHIVEGIRRRAEGRK